MKLMIAIINKDDAEAVSSALNEAGHYVTKLTSTGGLFSKGSVTLLIATDDDQIEPIRKIIKAESKTRTEKMPTMNSLALPEVSAATMVDVGVGGATVFVLNIEQFFKF